MEPVLEWFGIKVDVGAGRITVTITNIVFMLLAAWFLLSILLALIRRLHRHMDARAADLERRKRLQTLARVFRYIGYLSVFAVAGMLILDELGVSITPLLGAAGLTGFALLLENQIRVGDVVEVEGKCGLAEEVTLRYVRLRGYDGTVHFVPTGEISIVTNMTREFAVA